MTQYNTISSRFVDDCSTEEKAFVLPKVTSYKPKFTKSLCDWSIFDNLTLADPHFASDAKFELILRGGVYVLIIQEGVTK